MQLTGDQGFETKRWAWHVDINHSQRSEFLQINLGQPRIAQKLQKGTAINLDLFCKQKYVPNALGMLSLVDTALMMQDILKHIYPSKVGS